MLPSNYITFIPESSTFRFVANDGFGDINGHSQIDTDFINSITGTFHSVVVLGSATVGNPSGYNYSLASGFGKEQYYMFSAIEFGSNLGDRNLSSAGSFRNASATSTGTLPYISGEIGPSTSGTTPPCLYASPLRLPHGAILNQSSRLDAYFVGNGNTLFPISIGIYYASQSFSATPIPLYFIQSNEVGNTILQSGTSGDAVHSIDNQNNYYFVKISLPADPSLGSLPASKFFSARLNYFMPSVNN